MDLNAWINAIFAKVDVNFQTVTVSKGPTYTRYKFQPNMPSHFEERV